MNRLAPAAFELIFLIAAAPDPLQRQLIADAKATKPVAFERTLRQELAGKSVVYVDRYDPARTQPWALVSIDGRAPKPDEMGAWRTTIRNGVPAYARVAILLGAAEKVDDTHYRVAKMPKGFMSRDGFADHLSAQLTIDTSAPKPFVREVHFYAAQPFRMFMVVKVDKFDAINRYGPDAGGIPRIVAQDTTIVGSGPGISGAQATHLTFKPLTQ